MCQDPACRTVGDHRGQNGATINSVNARLTAARLATNLIIVLALGDHLDHPMGRLVNIYLGRHTSNTTPANYRQPNRHSCL